MASASEKIYVEHVKGVNGLDKVILREIRGWSAEVFPFLISFSHFLRSFLCILLRDHSCLYLDPAVNLAVRAMEINSDGLI
ncbi:hypothetical protein Gotur_019632 [Gossypium turneri]